MNRSALTMMPRHALVVSSDCSLPEALALPGLGARLGVAPDGTWACVVYDGTPRAVGLVELSTGEAGAPVAVADPVYVSARVFAPPGPPRTCVYSFVSTTEPVVSVVALGLSLGGYLPAPGPLGALQTWFWSLPWP